ncbi:hypothetical protein [Klebsiella pneumoniae]|uniref:hypothetical protein n=1 Tax=Klebsiella pneumoniae TaxID=573 RepID=UPI0022CDEF3A|nr:hypothetical protein [Klebsiella pneumoniae]
MDYQTRLNSDITKEIDYLASLRKQRMVADLRTELVYGSPGASGRYDLQHRH